MLQLRVSSNDGVQKTVDECPSAPLLLRPRGCLAGAEHQLLQHLPCSLLQHGEDLAGPLHVAPGHPDVGPVQVGL